MSVNPVKSKIEIGRRLSVCFSLLVALCVTSYGHAQSTGGSFVGRVVDQGGAIVRGASVTLTDEATSISQKQVTNDAGEYSFNAVQQGVYQLQVEASGFETAVIQHINLDVAQAVREDMQLKAGRVSTTVVVSAENPLIQTDSFSVSTVVDSNQIQEIPIDGRQGTGGLQVLAAGVQNVGTNTLVAGSSFQGGSNETVDGISINDILNARLSDAVPSLDAVAQFTIIANNAPAEYGNGSAQIIVQTKSGANQFHGSLFEFNRNRDLAARNYFLLPSARNPSFNRNEYGGSFGGPILRNKLFFFFAYEGANVIQSSTNQFDEPPASWTQPALTGADVTLPTSVVVNGVTYSSKVYNPNTGAPFAGNTIPANLIDPTAKKFLAYFSTPNIVTANGLGNNFSYSTPTYTVDPRLSIRFDYQADAKDHLTFSYYFNHNKSAPFGLNQTDKFGNYSLDGGYLNRYAATYTRVFSSSIVNEFDFGLYQFQNPRLDQNNNVDPDSLVPGLPPTPPGNGELPTVNINSFTSIRAASNNFRNSTQHAYQFYDNVNILKGKHSIKFGGQLIAAYEGLTQFNTGSFTFLRNL